MFAFAESIGNRWTRCCARLRYGKRLPSGKDEAGSLIGTGILLHRKADIAIACAVCACGYGYPVFAGVRRPLTAALCVDGEIAHTACGCEICAVGIDLKGAVSRAGLIDRVGCRANGNRATSRIGAGVGSDSKCHLPVTCASAIVDGYPVIRATRCRPATACCGINGKVKRTAC